MKTSIEQARQVRTNFVRLVSELSIEALNEIPSGFNNNIAWNFAHVVAVQQTLCYLRSGLEPCIPAERVMKYFRGTRPEAFIGEEEIGYYLTHAFSLLDQLEEDLDAGVFKTYDAFTNLMGIRLETISDAVTFFPIHDSVHLGYAMSLRRVVSRGSDVPNFYHEFI